MEETKAEPGTYKSICIIGAGASGLIVMKELLEVGINVSNNTYRHNCYCLRSKRCVLCFRLALCYPDCRGRLIHFLLRTLPTPKTKIK